jgi:hypothetical protein
MVTVVLMIAGIANAFTFLTRCVAIVKYLHFKAFSVSFFLSYFYILKL